jgi:hypothetical protein
MIDAVSAAVGGAERGRSPAVLFVVVAERGPDIGDRGELAVLR